MDSAIQNNSKQRKHVPLFKPRPNQEKGEKDTKKIIIKLSKGKRTKKLSTPNKMKKYKGKRIR